MQISFARMGLIFITAGQRPAVFASTHNCLKGRTFAPFLSCLSGRCLFVFTPQVAAIALPAVMKILPLQAKIAPQKKN